MKMPWVGIIPSSLLAGHPHIPDSTGDFSLPVQSLVFPWGLADSRQTLSFLATLSAIFFIT